MDIFGAHSLTDMTEAETVGFKNKIYQKIKTLGRVNLFINY